MSGEQGLDELVEGRRLFVLERGDARRSLRQRRRNRLLAYVYRASDGVFVNDEIVRQGYAQPLTIPPNVTFSDPMVEAARDAEADDAGLWSACG